MLVELLRPDSSWQEILLREGVSFRVVDDGEPDRDAVLIVPLGIGACDRQRVLHHYRSGGSLVADVDAAAQVWPERVGRRVRLRRLASERSVLFMNQGDIELRCRGRLLRHTSEAGSWSHRPILTSGREGRGLCFILPFNLASALNCRVSVDRVFPAAMQRKPFETVAAVDRGGLRRLIANGLRAIAWTRGEPYVHLSYSPLGLTSGFGFRIDVDRSTTDAVRQLVEFALSRGMRFTWFLSTGIGASLVQVVNNLRGQDIQLHGHMHRVFPDVASNLANFKRSREILSQMGIVVQAAAAPYGEWSPQLERAFSEMNLNYSSEFGFVYDDLPGFPPDFQNGEPVLQVPVHPICIGRLRWSKATPKQMLRYFMYVIDTQNARMEPCFLYEHPDDICRVPAVVREVLDYGLSRCGGELNMTDYAGWWRRRSKLKFAAVADSTATTIGIEAGEASDMTVTLEWANHVAALSLKTGRFLHERLRRVPRPESPQPSYGRVQSGFVSTMLFRLRSRRRRLQKHFQTRRLTS